MNVGRVFPGSERRELLSILMNRGVRSASVISTSMRISGVLRSSVMKLAHRPLECVAEFVQPRRAPP